MVCGGWQRASAVLDALLAHQSAINERRAQATESPAAASASSSSPASATDAAPTGDLVTAPIVHQWIEHFALRLRDQRALGALLGKLQRAGVQLGTEVRQIERVYYFFFSSNRHGVSFVRLQTRTRFTCYCWAFCERARGLAPWPCWARWNSVQCDPRHTRTRYAVQRQVQTVTLCRAIHLVAVPLRLVAQVVINTLVRRALFVRLYRAAREAQLQERRDAAAAGGTAASSSAFRPSLAAFDMRFFDAREPRMSAIDVGDTGAITSLVASYQHLCRLTFPLSLSLLRTSA